MDAKFNATVAPMVFENPESGWPVIEAHDAAGGVLRLSGTFGVVAEGMRVMASGRWDKHQGK